MPQSAPPPLLRSRGFWIGIALVALLLAAIFGYVEIKNRDCKLLCGEQAVETKYVVSGGISRGSSKPVRSSCSCG